MDPPAPAVDHGGRVERPGGLAPSLLVDDGRPHGRPGDLAVVGTQAGDGGFGDHGAQAGRPPVGAGPVVTRTALPSASPPTRAGRRPAGRSRRPRSGDPVVVQASADGAGGVAGDQLVAHPAHHGRLNRVDLVHGPTILGDPADSRNGWGAARAAFLGQLLVGRPGTGLGAFDLLGVDQVHDRPDQRLPSSTDTIRPGRCGYLVMPALVRVTTELVPLVRPASEPGLFVADHLGHLAAADGVEQGVVARGRTTSGRPPRGCRL